MGITALHILWLVSAFTLTTQDFVELSTSPRITAQCGKQVTLHCNVSSSLIGLSIKHMQWSHNAMALCSVDGEGKVLHNNLRLGNRQCAYTEGRLSVIFDEVLPEQSGAKPYRCKIQSNKGVQHQDTTVELEECGGIVRGLLTRDGPACTFDNVHPDGDVHWLNGSHNLSDGSPESHTTKRVKKGGWLTIHSQLMRKSAGEPYNCSLKSSRSGRYIASTLVHSAESLARDRASERVRSHSHNSGVGSQKCIRTLLCITVLLAITLK